jgi:hypothetical protein
MSQLIVFPPPPVHCDFEDSSDIKISLRKIQLNLNNIKYMKHELMKLEVYLSKRSDNDGDDNFEIYKTMSCVLNQYRHTEDVIDLIIRVLVHLKD